MSIRNLAVFSKFLILRSYSKMQHHFQGTTKLEMRELFDRAIQAVQPNSLLRSSIKVQDCLLKVRDKQYSLNKNCYIVGFGKAVLGMAYEAEHILGHHLVSGIVSVPEGIQNTMKYSPGNSILTILEGAKHNLPDKNAMENAIKIKEMVEKLDKSDIVIVLISGGGSSLLPLPLPPITLDEKCETVKKLATSGASINELNCVRKRLSVLKGGGLAQLIYPAQVVSLILSDICGDPLDLIASGPTVLNNDSLEAAFNIVKKYSLLDKIPSSVKECLSKNKRESLVELKNFSHVQNVLIGSNLTAISKATELASSKGYCTVILSDSIEGNVSDVGNMYAMLTTCICKVLHNKNGIDEVSKVFQILRQTYIINENAEEEVLSAIKHFNKKEICLIAGGETTVLVKGSGIGGRNQELAMIFSRNLGKDSETLPILDQFETVFLSAGTDGIDGPTDAAGAFGYRQQYSLAQNQNLNPDQYQVNNDSYNFYSKFNNGEDLIVTGHTGTNVMDVHILIIRQIK